MKNRHLVLNNLPCDIVPNYAVTMHNLISEADNSRALGYAVVGLSIEVAQLRKCFANDDELVVNAGPQQLVFSDLGKVLPPVNSTIAVAASSISERSLRDSGCIELNLMAVGDLKKIGILRVWQADQIDFPCQERFKAFLKAKPAIRGTVPVLA